MRVGNESSKEEYDDGKEGTVFMRRPKVKTSEMMNTDELDKETSRMTERLAILRIATEHINLWTRQLEMKLSEVIKLAGLMKLEGVKRR